MKKLYFLFFGLHATALAYSQNVGVGNTTPLGKLHIKGSANNSQLIIDANSIQINTAPLIKLRSSVGNDLLWIHSDTSFNTFIGLNAGRVNNAVGGALNNTFIGRDVGYSNTTGSFNSAFGKGALYTNTTGSYNTASGEGALFSNTTGTLNSAYGHLSLNSNTTGFLNSAHGYGSLFSNTTGKWNSAYGSRTLFSNTTGVNNSALGIDALYSNINGAGNTAIGYSVLYANTSGYLNSAKGYLALRLNTMGYENTAVGPYAMFSNTTGSQNTALGLEALISNTTGTYNTAIGAKANVASGELNNATAIGANASVATSNSIVLGSIQGVNGATESTNVGIGTSSPNPKAILEIKSTNQGVLFPMLTTAQRDAIVSPPHGLHIFNTDEECLNYYNSTYQYWACYCDACETTIIHIEENDCSIDFYNEYAPEDPDAKYIIVVDPGVIISTCQLNGLGAIHFIGVPSPRTITIYNYGTIEGLGGNGGDGNIISLGGNCNINYPSENGTEGGLAIKTISGVTIQIINHGTIAGGGGGGGAGDGNPSGFGGGGGGGAGINSCLGGNGGGERFWNGSSCQFNQLASPGSNGTVTMGGVGGAGASGGGTGGNGGGRGLAGQSGMGQNPGTGGAAGKAISGGSGNTITNMGSGQSFGVID